MATQLKDLDDAIRAEAVRNLATIKKAIATQTQKSVAERMGLAPPTLSDWADAHVERCCGLIAAAGLKIVGMHDRTVSPDDYRYLLKQQIRQAERELSEMPDTRPGDL